MNPFFPFRILRVGHQLKCLQESKGKKKKKRGPYVSIIYILSMKGSYRERHRYSYVVLHSKHFKTIIGGI